VNCKYHKAPYSANFAQSSVTVSFLGPNVFLCTLFSNTRSLDFSFNAIGKVSYPRVKTGKIVVQYISFLYFLDNKREATVSWNERKQALPEFNL
jgi:hypothetical protein